MAIFSIREFFQSLFLSVKLIAMIKRTLISPAPMLSSNPPANGACKLKKRIARKKLLIPKETTEKSNRLEKMA